MAIIPQNVYYGIKTKYLNKFKIDYQGTVATVSDLPEGDIPKGTIYNVEANGSNYLWNGEEWDELGSNDDDLVHKTKDETIDGSKTFSKNVSILFENKVETTPSQSVQKEYNFVDEDGALVGAIRLIHASSGSRRMRFIVTNASKINRFFDYVLASASNTLQTDNIEPKSDNTANLGSSESMWANLYVSSGEITASDERLKTSIGVLPDEVLDAWEAVNWERFQYKNAVQIKGENARYHVGLIAQKIGKAFAAKGVDAAKFGLFCYDEWNEHETVDEQGEAVLVPAGERYSIRYEEALAMEAAYQRRRADRAEARIKALEDRLEALEARLA